MYLRLLFSIVLAIAIILPVAEQSAVAQGQGTTVQLPTFSFFSVPTTVSVPDRGSAYLGGIKRASSGRNEFGTPMLPFRPFKNTGIGSERSAGQMHVTARIHDFEAMDEYLLSQPTQTRPLDPWSGRVAQGSTTRSPAYATRTPAGQAPVAQLPPGAGSSWQLSPAASDPFAAAPIGSVAQERARREQLLKEKNSEALKFYERGANAEKSGKANVAKIYYQMAARRAQGQLKTQVLARLDAIQRSQAGTTYAGQ